MGHVVTAPLVISKDAEGRYYYAYEGQPLPEFVGGDQLKRFVDEGMVEETKSESDGPKQSARKSSK